MKRYLQIVLAFVLICWSRHAFAQGAGDFRSKQTGNWQTAGTWEKFDGAQWNNAITAPSSSDGVITVLSGHTVTVNSVVTADQIIVNTGGTLVISNNIMTVNDGAGNDLDVNGTLTFSGGTIQGTGLISINGSATFTWTNGTMKGSGITKILSTATATFSGSNNGIVQGTRSIENFTSNFVLSSSAKINLGKGTSFTNKTGGLITISGNGGFGFSNSGSGASNLTNEGTITKSGGTGTSNLTTDASQTFTNSGTVNVNMGTVNIAGSGTNSGTYTIASGATLTGSTSMSFTGSTFTNNGSVALTSLTFSGTAVQSLNGSGGNINSLTIDNLSGVNTGGDQTINSSLSLTNGTINTGINKVIMAPGSIVSRTNGWVNGNLQKNIATGTNVSGTFEIGDASNYSPATVLFSSVTIAGDLVAIVTGSDYADFSGSGINPAKSVNRYWSFKNSATVFTTYNITLNYLSSDKDPGTTESNFTVAKKSIVWQNPLSVTTGNNTITANGFGSFSDFIIGEPSCPAAATISGSASICKDFSTNLTITLSGTAPWSFTYNDGSNDIEITGINTSPYNLTVAPIVNTTYTLISVSDANCTTPVLSQSATVAVNERPAAIITSTPTAICYGDTTDISGTVAASGAWTLTLSSGSTDEGTGNGPFNIPASPSDTTIYTIYSLIDQSCFALPADLTGTDTVMVRPKLQANITNTSTSICNGQTTIISGTVTAEGNWTLVIDPGGIDTSGTGNANFNIEVTPSTTTTYTISSLSNDTCSALAADLSGSAVVFVNSDLSAAITSIADTTICYGGTAYIKGTVTANGPWTIKLSSGDELSGSGSSFSIPVSPDTVTIYTIVSLKAGSCSAPDNNLTDTATVIVRKKLKAKIASDQETICIGQLIYIHLKKITAPGNWTLTLSTGDSITGHDFNNKDTTISVSPSSTTIYTITSLTNGTCSALAEDLKGSATVTVNSPLSASITSADATICYGDSVTISGAVTADGTWTLNLSPAGSIATSGNAFNIKVAPTSTTIYTIHSLTNGVCSALLSDLTGSDTITVKPKLFASITDTTQTICLGETVTIPVTVGGTDGEDWNFTLSNNQIVNGIGDTFINIIVSPDTATTYTISSLSVGTCSALLSDLNGTDTVIVSPIPTVDIPASQTVCNGGSTSLIHFTGIATSFDWTNDDTSINLGAGDSGDISSFTATNAGNSPSVATITVTPMYTLNEVICSGTSQSFTITVLPTPNVIPVNSQTVCNGANTVAIDFTGIATEFNWTNDNQSINLPPIGSGNIGSFIALNNGIQTEVANIAVTPWYSLNGVSCSGDTIQFHIYVNPTPNVFDPGDQVVCNNELTNQIMFNGAVSGAIYSWTFSSDIGMGLTGTGNIAPFPAINSSDDPITAVITVIPEKNSCIGDTQTFIITVNPSPKVNPIADTTYCNGDSTSEIPFSSPTADSLFYWSNNNTSIGLTNQGIGYSLPAFLAMNSSTTQSDTAVITVSAKANGCEGPESTFNIIINPSPPSPLFNSFAVNEDTIKLCAGSENINFNVISPMNTVTYSWSVFPETGVDIGVANDPNTVISFNDIGFYTVTLTATNPLALGSCTASESQIVNVSADNNSIIERAIILKQPGNLLVYPDNSLDGYQWGYDSIIEFTVNDTILGPPFPIPDRVYQVFIPLQRLINANGQLETIDHAYWVLLRRGACSSKVYYNGPYAYLKPAEETDDDLTIGVNVYPNPNDGSFNISLHGNIYGNIITRIFNMLGEKVYENTFLKNQNETTYRIDNLILPDGIYMLELTKSDHQRVSARIIITN